MARRGAEAIKTCFSNKQQHDQRSSRLLQKRSRSLPQVHNTLKTPSAHRKYIEYLLQHNY
jgi:hypothetical protein